MRRRPTWARFALRANAVVLAASTPEFGEIVFLENKGTNITQSFATLKV